MGRRARRGEWRQPAGPSGGAAGSGQSPPSTAGLAPGAFASAVHGWATSDSTILGSLAGMAWRAAGLEHQSLADDAANALANALMQHRNMLPEAAEATARTIVAAGRERARASNTDTIEKLGDRMLRGQPAFCQALIDIEHVHVNEIREWWDEPGFMRQVYLILTDQEWQDAKDQFAGLGADDAIATACAWRIAPVFASRTPVPGEDHNYTPLPSELWYRVRQTTLEPPWMWDYDPVAAIGSGEHVPTYNAWLRSQLAFGRIAMPVFDS